MKLLQSLQQQNLEEITQQVKELAELQQQNGEWSINGAAFIVIALFIILLFGTVFTLLIKSILNQQKSLTQKILNNEELLEKFNTSFDKNTQVLENVSNYLQKMEILNEEKAKREATTSQINHFLKSSLNSYKFKISENVARIIKENNIQDTEKTKEKVDKSLKNLYKNFITTSNAFLYNGHRLGELIEEKENNWVDLQYNLIQDYIYNKENRDINKFYNNLNILFDSIFQEIIQKLDF